MADVVIAALIALLKSNGRLATVTAVQPPGRCGVLEFGQNALASGFQEKPKGDGTWINSSFFALEPEKLERLMGIPLSGSKHPSEALNQQQDCR